MIYVLNKNNRKYTINIVHKNLNKENREKLKSLNNQLEKVNDILLKNIQYRDLIEQQKEEIKTYRKKFGRLEGGDKNDKDKNK